MAENDIVLFRKEKTLLINRFIHDQKNKRLIFRPDSQDPRFTDTILSYQEKETIELYGKVIAYIIEL